MSKRILDFSDHEAAIKLFDEAFTHPHRRYEVVAVDPFIAYEWVRENASMRHFGWGSDEKSHMRMGDLIHMDTLYYRERCGWVTDCGELNAVSNNGYLCDFPPDANSETCQYTGKRLCMPYQCPVAYEADREDIRRKDHDLWRTDYKPYPDEQPTDWMVLYARPRYAAVANVHVINLPTQAEMRQRAQEQWEREQATAEGGAV